MSGPFRDHSATQLSRWRGKKVCFFFSPLMHLKRSRPSPAHSKVQAPTDRRGWGFNDTQTGMLLGIPRSARCVQRFDDSLKICNSHYLSHFAAFFIDARAKRSVVESCIWLLFLKAKHTFYDLSILWYISPKAYGEFTGVDLNGSGVHMPPKGPADSPR